MKLSILIPTLQRRHKLLARLIAELEKQIGESKDIEILLDHAGRDKIGTKRNRLLQRAQGEYLCFVDDDDMVSEDYIQVLRDGMATGSDCLSLRGVMTTNGKNPEVFEHSIRYNSYKTTEKEIKYERYPNHLNCIRADIAKRFRFIDKNWGEDTEWATQIFNSGLIKTEAYSDKVIYYYLYRTQK